MIPLAFLKTLMTNCQKVMRAPTITDKIKLFIWVLIYCGMGIPCLLLGIFSDFFYFWANNFRSNLKKIIIVREESTITSESIRSFTLFCAKYNMEKIRAIHCQDTVRTMRQKYLIKENIQYLLFGQFINGNKSSLGTTGTQILKSTKTSNLKAYRSKIQELENTAEQLTKSRYEIDQYNQLKSILINLSYSNGNQKTLCVDIVENVMDELRRERKTKMVLDDAEIEQYIELDLAEAATMKKEDMSPFLRGIVEGKEAFKLQVCQTVSILRLGYMFKVLQAVHPGKASMLGADAFMKKVKKIEARSKQKKAFDINGAKSGIFSTAGSQDMINMSQDNLGIKGSNEDIENPLLAQMDLFIQKLKQKFTDTSQERIKDVEKILKEKAPVAPTMHRKTIANNDNNGAPLDTVEENLKRIESNRNMAGYDM